MSDFNPIALFAIAREMLGATFWPAAAAIALLVGTVGWAAIHARRQGYGLRSGLVWGISSGMIVTAAATLLVPAWTDASVGDLRSAIDVVAAVAIALVPGILAGSVMFVVAAVTPRTVRRRRDPAIKAGIRENT